MMKNFLLTLSALCLFLVTAKAQVVLKNDGAYLVIEPGATVFIGGGLENINSGTINNDGTLEVQGDFINNATFDGSDPNTVIFSGSTATNVTSNGDAFDTVQINKDTGIDVNLVDNMTVGSELAFMSDNNKVNVGANNLVMQSGSTITGYDDNDYVVTDDVGFLKKESIGDGDAFTFPVGNDNTTYNPATITGITGQTTDDYSVRVRDHLYLDGLAETEPATELAADAMWDITEGTGGGSHVDVELQWASTDELTNFPTEVGISRHDGSNWDLLAADVSAPSGSDPYTQTRSDVTDFGAFAVGGAPLGHTLAMDMKVILQGTYSGGAPVMNDALRTAALIPATEPYSDAPYNYSFTGFGADERTVTDSATVFGVTGDNAIVDWMVVDLRDSGDSSVVVASKSALIQRDGDIVDLDGVSPLAIHGMPDGDYFIGIHHRNHLGIRTANTQALTNTPVTLDFTSSLALAYDDPGISGNDAMKLLSGGEYGLWAGDVNLSHNVVYNGPNSDRVEILNAVGNTTPNVILPNIYSIFDVNLDGSVKYNGSNADRTFILNEVVGNATPNKIIAEHQ